jgi:hypothetical protein
MKATVGQLFEVYFQANTFRNSALAEPGDGVHGDLLMICVSAASALKACKVEIDLTPGTEKTLAPFLNDPNKRPSFDRNAVTNPSP